MYVTIYVEERTGTISDKFEEIVSIIRKLFSEHWILDIDAKYTSYVLYLLTSFR